ncbi:MAG: cysteine methyltransferase [Candidatus Aenigmarchaeota archaeon]|nr:cysteine methyltransferase [Candidatus Aenigmarchaeota archaeon]
MDKMRELQILLTKIPKGKVTTYKIVAKKLRIHPRTAGRFLSKNPFPEKYPCYRVVYSDGRVVSKHIKLLKKEGIEIKQGKIDLKRFLISF